MNKHFPILDVDEKYSIFLETLKKSRQYFICTGLVSIVLFFLIFYLNLVELGIVIALSLPQLAYYLYLAQKFAYVYYYEWNDPTLTLFLFNLKGERLSISLNKEKVKKIKFLDYNNIIKLPPPHKKTLLLKGNLASQKLCPLITFLK